MATPSPMNVTPNSTTTSDLEVKVSRMADPTIGTSWMVINAWLDAYGLNI